MKITDFWTSSTTGEVDIRKFWFCIFCLLAVIGMAVAMVAYFHYGVKVDWTQITTALLSGPTITGTQHLFGRAQDNANTPNVPAQKDEKPLAEQ